MVSTDAALATQVGVEVLRKGGRAVDAAVAVAFALAVVYPTAGNLGGGGFAVIRMADGETASLDFRETAPGRATRDMYVGPGGAPTDRSLVGHLAVGVPGTVAGLWELHRRYGTVPWKELLAPAIALARDGFEVDAFLSSSIAAKADLLRRFPASAALFLPGGSPPPVGAIFRNPDLARTLERIAARGPKDFYRGETARLIVAEMKRGGGILTRADLGSYRPKWREPVQLEYLGHRIVTMGPPSSGGLTLRLALGILEGFDLPALGWHSPQAIHLVAEAMRRAYAVRNEVLGDPDFVEIPVDRFGAEAAARWRAGISLERATPSSDVSARLGVDAEGDHTTHFSIVDGEGNAVALTTTINSGYGSGVTVAGAGFLLNNEMDDFTTHPGRPNLYGLVQGEANAVAPRKRPLSSMTPTIVVAPDGRVRLVTGAQGGSRIISAVLQIVVNVVAYDLDVQAAVAAPRFHHQHLPDVLVVEPEGFRPETLRALEAMGHAIERATWPVGDAPSVGRRDHAWAGTPEPRRQGSTAAGF